MAQPISDYIAGFITLTNGSVDFTGSGTGWFAADLQEGDTIFNIPGATEYEAVIKTITDNGSGTIDLPWEGPDLVDVPYRMRYQSELSRASAKQVQLIDLLGNGNLEAFAELAGASNMIPMFSAPGVLVLIPKTELTQGVFFNVQVADLAARAPYDDRPGPVGTTPGFTVLVSDYDGNGSPALTSKVSDVVGDWSTPAFLRGEVGPMVTIGAGTTTTLPALTPATFTVTPVTGGYLLNVGIPQGPQGVPGADGAQGPQGNGLFVNEVGNTADRALWDNEASGFTFFDVETGDLYFRVGATPGVWSDPIPFQGPPGTSGALITITDGVGNGTPGPYPIDAAPISAGSAWVSISGVIQYNYTFSGLTVTFGQPVAVGVPWRVQTSGPLPVGVVAPDSVGATEINGADADAIRDKINAMAGAGTVVDGAFAGFDGVGGDSLKQLSNSVATSMLNTFAVALKGLVPAPTAPDVAAGRFLRADGAWILPLGVPTGGTARQVLRKISATDGDAGWSNAIGFGTAQNSTAGASLDFTGIPAGCRRITVQLVQVSTNGNANYIVQLGAGAIQTTGYFGAAGNTAATDQYTTGFGIRAGAGTVVMNGLMIIERINGNSWVASGSFGRSDAASISSGGGSVTLSGELDRVRLTTVGGADTFDGGLVNITFE